MKSLQLLPGTHRQKEIVKVRFPYDLQLMVKLKILDELTTGKLKNN